MMPGGYRIAVVPGDGIGLEVVPPAVALVDAAATHRGVSLTWERFDWGCDRYLRTGEFMPADALAILADYFDEPPELVLAALRSMWAPRSKAAAFHQSFKERFVVRERRDEWELHSDDIEAWLQTSSIRTRLCDLAREDAELTQLRRLEQEGERADADAAD